MDFPISSLMLNASWSALPLEIRRSIYHFAFCGGKYAAVEGDLVLDYTYKPPSHTAGKPEEGYRDASWLLTSGTIYREAVEQFYQHAECTKFHVKDDRVSTVAFSPFRIAKIKYFSFEYPLTISESKNREDLGVVDVVTDDRYRSSRFNTDGNRWVIPSSSDEADEGVDNEDEGCRRLAALLTESQSLAVKELTISFDIDDGDPTESLTFAPDKSRWDVRFAFLEAFGSMLERVTFDLEIGEVYPVDENIVSRHMIILILQKHFINLGQSMVTGVSEGDCETGFVATVGGGTTREGVMVERAPCGTAETVIDLWGLQYFYDDMEDGRVWYKRKSDDGDGVLRFSASLDRRRLGYLDVRYEGPRDDPGSFTFVPSWS